MTTTFTLTQGARSAALITMGALVADTYKASSAIDLGAAIPQDLTIEVEATATSPTGDQQVNVFAQLSLDNINFGSGPTTGTSSTDEEDLHWIGALPMNSTGTHRKFFSLAHLPITRYLKLVVRNRTGVTLTNGFVYTSAITEVGT